MWNYCPRYGPWEKTPVFNLATCCCIAERSLTYCKPYVVLAKEILNRMEVKIILLEVCSKKKKKKGTLSIFLAVLRVQLFLNTGQDVTWSSRNLTSLATSSPGERTPAPALNRSPPHQTPQEHPVDSNHHASTDIKLRRGKTSDPEEMLALVRPQLGSRTQFGPPGMGETGEGQRRLTGW